MLKKILILIFLMYNISNIFAQSRIYLIRHAKVNIDNPHWCNYKQAQKYKNDYNFAPINNFIPEKIISKIDNAETIDSIFCSPLFRAQKTANIIFNNKIKYITDTELAEFDYPVLHCPIILPIKFRLIISRLTWMLAINKKDKPSFKYKKLQLKIYSEKIIKYAQINNTAIVVAHGMLNRELIKILKKQGWKYERKEGLKNLSVNCLIK